MQPITGKKIHKEIINNFIQGQLRPNKVLNPAVLEAFNRVDRCCFLPSSYQSFAYADANFKGPKGRFLISALLLGRLINLVDIQSTDRCLIIGAAYGYSAAILACLSENVFALEQEQSFYKVMCHNLQNTEQVYPKLHLGVLTEGWQEQAPFEFILIEGGVEIIPQKILDQVSEQGFLVAIHNKNNSIGSGCRWQKTKGILKKQYLFDVYIPTLQGFEKKKVFFL